MLEAMSPLQRQSPYGLGGAALLLATAVILVALAFEHIGGYVPCPLCLQQRYAYYAGIPALAGALYLVFAGRSGPAAAVFAAVGLAFLANAGLGTYQAGAEWGFCAPPATCAALGELRELKIGEGGLDAIPAGCGVATWRLLGLSFAGWNVAVSLLLAAAAAAAALDAATGTRERGIRETGTRASR
jgi:disulfide bond formation protein DsbB